MNGCRNILIVKTSSIGDVVHALPIAQVIQEQMPGVKLGWVVRRRCADLLTGNPYIDRVHIVADRPSIAEIAAVSKEMRREAYDICLEMQGLALSGLLALVSGAKRRIGLDLNRECNRLFLTEASVPGYRGQERHAIDILKGFLPAIGLADDAEWPALGYLPVLTEQMREWLKPGVENVGLNIGASSVYKQWPLDRWSALARRVIEQGKTAVLIGGPGERGAADRIAESLPQSGGLLFDAVGKTSLREAAGLISKCSAVVSADSGLMHIAVAVGTPVVALFGSTNPRKTGPYGDRNAVIWPKIACAPCYRNPTCNGRVDCMKMIEVEQVLSKIAVWTRKECGVSK